MLRIVPVVAITRIPRTDHRRVPEYKPALTPTFALMGLLVASIGCAEGGGNAGVWAEDGLHDCDGSGGGIDDESMPTCEGLEVCDGVDDEDCDGTVDEDCGRCPLMTVSCPTGCCAVDSWAVGAADSKGSEIAVDAAGNIFFAFTKVNGGSWQSALAIYDAVPGTWREVALGGGHYRNRIRIDAMGRLHVANATDNDPKGITYRRSDDHGVTFTTPVTIGVPDIGGTFDMEVDSAGQPHFAYEADAPYGSALRYTHLVGTSWTTETLDSDTDYKQHPDLSLGFADRPHIVFEAHNPPGVSGQAKRYVFHNGNHWIEENVDVAGQASYPGDDYFTAHTLRIASDDSREVLFMRRIGVSDDTLLLARRGPLDSDTWQVTPITGATEVMTPTMFIDHHGKRGAVSTGVRLHREQAGTTWTTTNPGVAGRNVAAARRGRYLYLGYTTGTSLNGAPTVKVIDLGQ